MSGRLTQMAPAQDRGVIREGAFADLVVFDSAAVADRVTFDDPVRPSTRVSHVLVNGAIVFRDGVPAEEGSGQVIRRART